MTTTSNVPGAARLVGLRLHARRGPGGAPADAAARALLDLQERQRQRDTDLQALRELVRAARVQVEALPGAVQERLDEVAGIAVELGLAIAGEIVGAALAQGRVDPTPTVARCLADCVHGTDRTDLVVRLHPADLAVVEARLHELSVRDPAGFGEDVAAAKFVADPGVPRGGVRAETGAGRLSYDPRDVLERICAEVRREATA